MIKDHYRWRAQVLIVCAFDAIGSCGNIRLVNHKGHGESVLQETGVLVTKIKSSSHTGIRAEQQANIEFSGMSRLVSTGVRRRLSCKEALRIGSKPLRTPTPYLGASDPLEQPSDQLSGIYLGAAGQASSGGLAECIETAGNLSVVT